MESAQSLANNALAEIRRKNNDENERRRDEVRKAAPEFADIEEKLIGCGIALSKCVLGEASNIPQIREKINSLLKEKADILAKLGLPKDYLDEIYNCEKCRDTGFDEKGMRCECFKNMVTKFVGINSNLTDVMRGESFKNFDFTLFVNQPDIKGISALKLAEMAYKKAESFAGNFDTTKANLYLYGNAGTGKTYLSSCIANRVLERGFTVYYQSAFKLLDMLERLKFGRMEDDELAGAEYTAKYILSVDLLIIDDVGTEFVSAYSSAALFDIINTRLNAEKSTVISSNLNPDKIEEIYGARMSSRVVGSFDPVPVYGADLRKIKLKREMKANR